MLGVSLWHDGGIILTNVIFDTGQVVGDHKKLGRSGKKNSISPFKLSV